MPPRHSNWPALLAAFIRDRRHRPYAYGTNDCGTMVQDWVTLATGVDPMPPTFVRPTSRIAAARFLLQGGYADVEGLAAKALGPPLAALGRAGRGDIVSFEVEGERHLGIVAGAVAFSPGVDGLVWVPRLLWCNGWKVG